MLTFHQMRGCRDELGSGEFNLKTSPSRRHKRLPPCGLSRAKERSTEVFRFKDIDLGDRRLDKRTVLLAERMAANPLASIPPTG